MANVPSATLIVQLINRLSAAGIAPDDNPQLRLNKIALTRTFFMIALLAMLGGSTYVALGLPVPGSIPLGYAVLSFVSMFFLSRNKNFALFRVSQLLLILMSPFLLQWSLGGFARGSAVMIWAVMSPLTALYFGDMKQASKWIVGFVTLTIVSGLIDSYLATHIIVTTPSWATTLSFVVNMGFGGITIFVTLGFLYKARKDDPAADRTDHIIQTNDKAPSTQVLEKNLITEHATSHSNYQPIISSLISEEPELIDLVVQFTESLPGIMSDIETAFINQNITELKDNVHSLKGVSGNFGYRELYETARTLEMCIIDGDHASIANHINQLKLLMHRIQKGIRNPNLFEQTDPNDLKKAAGN